MDTTTDSQKLDDIPSRVILRIPVGRLGSIFSTLYISPEFKIEEEKEKEEYLYSIESEKPFPRCRSAEPKAEGVLEVQPAETPPAWHLVTDSDEFDEIGEAIAMADCPVCLDLETYGRDALNSRRSDIRLLSLALPGQTPWLIDLQATGYDLGGLGEVLASSDLIIHNARFDLGFLRHHCRLRAQRVFCTMTAARLLSAGTRQSNRLGDVLRRYDIADLAKEHGASDWGGMLFDDQLAYAALDVAHLFDLHQKLKGELEAAGLSQVMELESRLLPVVVDMEADGFDVDKAKLTSLRDAHRQEATELGNDVQELLGGTFNPGSPDQLKAAFNAAGVNIDSTAEGVLVKVKHPAAAKVLQMRGTESVAKQAQSLIDAIEDDGRIHGEFDPTGTEAGRFSAKRPNLQNVGRGSLRECFIAPAGETLVCADYSQIELRVAAAIAGETKMLEAYRSGADLHRRTAALVLGKSEDEVTKDDRQLAKAVNFGLIYGQSAAGLVDYAKSSYGVTMTEGEAERIREKFFRAYKGLAKWHDEMRALANRGYEETRTRLGRRRLMPKGSDKFWQRFSGGLNTPVQGGAADGLKHALVLLAEHLPAGAAIISTVHDEIIVRCAEADADAVKTIMETAMREAMAELYPEVPIVVEAHNGNTWASAK